MFKNLFKKRNNNQKKILGLTEIENYNIAVNSNVNTEQLYRSLSQDKINLLESLDGTINNLNSKRIIKEKYLEEVNKKIKTAETKLEICKHNINSYKHKQECSICNDNNIDIALVPCGHTYCFNCIRNSPNCFICRQQIHSFLRIYFN